MQCSVSVLCPTSATKIKKKKMKSEMQHRILQNEILRNNVSWQLKLLPRMVQMARTCSFSTSEAFSHTFLLDYILHVQWIKTIRKKNIWRSYSDINNAVFCNVHGVTSQNNPNLYHHVISKQTSSLCLSDLKVVSNAELKRELDIGRSVYHFLQYIQGVSRL